MHYITALSDVNILSVCRNETVDNLPPPGSVSQALLRWIILVWSKSINLRMYDLSGHTILRTCIVQQTSLFISPLLGESFEPLQLFVSKPYFTC